MNFWHENSRGISLLSKYVGLYCRRSHPHTQKSPPHGRETWYSGCCPCHVWARVFSSLLTHRLKSRKRRRRALVLIIYPTKWCHFLPKAFCFPVTNQQIPENEDTATKGKGGLAFASLFHALRSSEGLTVTRCPRLGESSFVNPEISETAIRVTSIPGRRVTIGT